MRLHSTSWLAPDDSHPSRSEVASHRGLDWHSPMTNDVKHLFMCLSAIFVSFKKYLFRFFAYFEIGLVVILLLSCKNSLYILDTRL